MTKRPTIIERAYELAGEGYLVEPIVQKLNAEGYEGAFLHLSGAGIRAKLKRIRKRAITRVG